MDQYEFIRISHRIYGDNISEVVRKTGHARNTVKKATKGEPWGYKERKNQRHPVLGPYLEIIDNGPGIREQDMEHIFEPFFTTAEGGTGLGLYIARELCESNRLGLDYLSVPTGGSCFRISFPSTPQVI